MKLIGQGSTSKIYLINNVVVKIYNHKTKTTIINKEINILNSLKKNKYTINILTSGFLDEHYFIKMEYLDAETLDKYIFRQPVNFNIKFDIIIQLLNGFISLNKSRIYHGDIKLENILITNLKQIKIIDFGLSCKKKCIMNGGTVVYSSPEVLISYGNPHKVSEYDMKISDTFSLGIVFYLILTSSFPFIIKFNPYPYNNELLNKFYSVTCDTRDTRDNVVSENSKDVILSTNSDKCKINCHKNLADTFSPISPISPNESRCFDIESVYDLYNLYKFWKNRKLEKVNTPNSLNIYLGVVEKMLRFNTRNVGGRLCLPRILNEFQKIK